MPKKVDHQQQPRELAEALWRIAARDGLEGASLGHVAAEAGVSKGRLQHYFTSREALVAYAAELLRERVDQRLRTYLTQIPPDAPAQAILRSFAATLLPTDDASRTQSIVSTTFFLRGLGDPIVAERFRTGHQQLIDFLAGQVLAGQQAGGAQR